jgi:hypothetical protein
MQDTGRNGQDVIFQEKPMYRIILFLSESRVDQVFSFRKQAGIARRFKMHVFIQVKVNICHYSDNFIKSIYCKTVCFKIN